MDVVVRFRSGHCADSMEYYLALYNVEYNHYGMIKKYAKYP